MTLYGTGEQGETVQVTVKSFTDSDVTIDYNHPMAGKTLMFSVTVLSLRDATEEEIQTGVVGGMAAMGGGCCGGGGHDHGEGGGCCSSEPQPQQSHGGCGCSH
jgi:FKBP-type peptidyl-prolyl cis-trans isomerase SlyD